MIVCICEGSVGSSWTVLVHNLYLFGIGKVLIITAVFLFVSVTASKSNGSKKASNGRAKGSKNQNQRTLTDMFNSK